jgi:hypothetical protein
MTKEEKKNIAAVLKMQKTLIDSIYNSCKENAEIFEVNYVPTNYVGMIGDVALDSLTTSLEGNLKLMKDGKEKKMVEDILAMNAKAIDTIKSQSNKSAKDFNVDYVPIKVLKTICDNTWTVLESGLKEGFGN